MTANFKIPVIRDKQHRMFIASLPCVVSGSDNVQCAHIRKGNGAGLGMKPSDDTCVPLSIDQHRIQHEIGEHKFWESYGGIEKATKLAKTLYEFTGDTNRALEEIARWR